MHDLLLLPDVMAATSIGIGLCSVLLHIAIVQLYSPRRPVVDIAEVFLWMMAVGTILYSSYWSAWSAREAFEHYNRLEDAQEELHNYKNMNFGGVMDISTTSAVLFVVVASDFLVIIYKLMSAWFVELLVVLFCIGGAEGLQTCLAELLSSFSNQLQSRSLEYQSWEKFPISLWLFLHSASHLQLFGQFIVLPLMPG